jgi:hypothetical protein
MAKKQDFSIRVDDRNDLCESLTDFLESADLISKKWQVVRLCRPTKFWLDLLGPELLDLLDSIADIYNCTQDECREPCWEDWDFCLQHGADKSC